MATKAQIDKLELELNIAQKELEEARQNEKNAKVALESMVDSYNVVSKQLKKIKNAYDLIGGLLDDL